MTKKDARKTGWNKNFLKACKDFKTFEKYFDANFKYMDAVEVWESIGGELPEKKVDLKKE